MGWNTWEWHLQILDLEQETQTNNKIWGFRVAFHWFCSLLNYLQFIPFGLYCGFLGTYPVFTVLMKTICYGFYWARVKNHTVLKELKPALAVALADQARLLWLLSFADTQRRCVWDYARLQNPVSLLNLSTPCHPLGRPFRWLFTGSFANRLIQWGFLSCIHKKIRCMDSSPCLSIFPSCFPPSSRNIVNIFPHLHPFIPLNSGHQRLFLDALNNVKLTIFPLACLLTKWFT